MSDEIKISLAIVTYNNEEIISSTIHSVINNIPKHYDYRLYVVDNNSSDCTLASVSKINGHIEIIPLQINKGFGYGHNQVLPILDSKYHFIVNPDIIIENESQIDCMIKYMEQHEEVGMLSPLILNQDMSIQYLFKNNPTVLDMLLRWLPFDICARRKEAYVNMDTGYSQIMPIDYASGCFMLFRTDIFKKLHGFDEKFFMYLEDADITRRVNQVSKAVYYPETYVIQKGEKANYKKLKYVFITLHSMGIYFNKWGWRIF